MELKKLPYELSVCKVRELCPEILADEFFFIGKTDEELSLVCMTEHAPLETEEREDGWKAFRIQGILDFSLIGVLAPIATILADHQIGIFAVSTYNTDYILVKKENFDKAFDVLVHAGYSVI
jgi:hypothetical protein